MPLYEYACRQCGRQSELLIRPGVVPECPDCHGRDLDRLMSAFAVSSEATKQAAYKAGSARTTQMKRDQGDAEVAYHKKHNDH
jgi:putative FmdB family regulatory protein